MSDKDKPMFDAIEFYDLMQAYRIAPAIDQKQVTEAFEAVKAYIKAGFEQSRAELAEKDKRIAELEKQSSNNQKIAHDSYEAMLNALAKLDRAVSILRAEDNAQAGCNLEIREFLAELGDE